MEYAGLLSKLYPAFTRPDATQVLVSYRGIQLITQIL